MKGKALITICTAILAMSLNTQWLSLNAANRKDDGNLILSGKVVCNGRGISGVLITDGYNFVRTDKKGRYSLKANPAATTVSVTTPSGYKPLSNASVPSIHHLIGSQSSYDFTLMENPGDINHTLIVTTDIQMATKEDCEWYGDISADIREFTEQENGDIIGIDLGDIVADRPELYNGYLEKTDSIGIPIFRIIGNHDMNYYGHYFETSYQRFEKLFVPNRYSFNKGNVHYIFVDNCFYVGRDYFYMGYYSKDCFDWIIKDLSYVPEGSTVIICQHIPGRLSESPKQFKYDSATIQEQTVNFGELTEILGNYNVHILSGHSHLNNNYEHKEGIYEHNISAVCGGWWSGHIGLDGTPLGYEIINISGNDIRWKYKSSGKPAEHQFRYYNVGEDRNMPDYVTVNVWNWDSKWKVEMIENGEIVTIMEQYTGYDEEALKVYTGKAKQRYSWIYPVKTSHLFRAKPKLENSQITIRVTDRFGNVYESH